MYGMYNAHMSTGAVHRHVDMHACMHTGTQRSKRRSVGHNTRWCRSPVGRAGPDANRDVFFYISEHADGEHRGPKPTRRYLKPRLGETFPMLPAVLIQPSAFAVGMRRKVVKKLGARTRRTSLSASPTACPLRVYGRASTQPDRLRVGAACRRHAPKLGPRTPRTSAWARTCLAHVCAY